MKHQTTISFCILLFILTLSLVSCSNDNPVNNTDDPQNHLVTRQDSIDYALVDWNNYSAVYPTEYNMYFTRPMYYANTQKHFMKGYNRDEYGVWDTYFDSYRQSFVHSKMTKIQVKDKMMKIGYDTKMYVLNISDINRWTGYSVEYAVTSPDYVIIASDLVIEK